MCPCCCAGWISTGWPLAIPGDVEFDASLCPADALEMDAWRELVPAASWLTDSYLQSLFSLSQFSHFGPGSLAALHRIFRFRQHAVRRANCQHRWGQQRDESAVLAGLGKRGGGLSHCRRPLRGGRSACPASCLRRPSFLRRLMRIPS